MNRFSRLLFVSLGVAIPCLSLAATKKEKRAAKKQAETPVKSVTPTPSDNPANPWRNWSDGKGHTLEARFKGLEYGLLTIEDKEGTVRRIPLAKLSAEDRKFAEHCKTLQACPAFSQEIIAKAAARLDETILTALKTGKQTPNAPVSDEVFARRLYLDTIGRIPTQAELEPFFKDASPDKRAKLIDQLLNSPGYTMHMFNWLADMLRVKDDYGKGAKAFLFEDWLKDMVVINRPWDAIVSDMLTADGKLAEQGAAGLLLRDAQMPLDGVSNVLTTFLGADVSCAQCHDHPLAAWTQKDFYQMAAFFGAVDGYHEDVFKQIRSIARNGKAGQKNQVQAILGSNPYNLVDLPKNRLDYPKDYKYDNAKPGQSVAPALITWTEKDKFNPAYNIDTSKPQELRNEFAKWMTSPDNPRFATAIANRLWKKVFGLAVQEPVSDLDEPKASSNPELLAQITTYMKQAKFDLREFQRILLNTAAYQRGASPTHDPAKGHYLFAGPLVRRMSADQAWDSIVTLASGAVVDHCELRRGDELKFTAIQGPITTEAVREVMTRLKSAGVAVAKGGGGKKKGGTINANQLVQFYEGGTPQVTAGLLLARASELPQPAPESHFLRLFGQSDRMVSDTNTSDGSVPQVMALMNGPVQEAITGSSSAVLASVASAASTDAKVESLYLNFLARKPTSAERKSMTTALSGGLTAADCAWVLLNTREFLFIR